MVGTEVLEEAEEVVVDKESSEGDCATGEGEGMEGAALVGCTGVLVDVEESTIPVGLRTPG